MCEAIRLVLLGNDKCLRDSALRGGHCLAFSRFRCTSQLKWPIFKMSTTSQCVSAILFASIVMGILKNLWFCFTFPSIKWEFSICFVSSESLLSSLLLFSSLRFFFASLLFFSFQAILPSHHHSIFPLPLVSHVNCRWIERGGNPISSVQFSCSKSYMGDRVIILCSLPLLLLLHISIPLLPRLFPS